MKDEFPKTRKFCVVLQNTSSIILSIIKSDNSHASEYYQSMYNRALDAREREIYELEEKYGYAEWTMENRPVIIRELIDSVEYRSDLQGAYDVWIKMLSEVETYDDHHFELMFGNRAKITAVDERGRRLLKDIRSIMKCVFIFAQELKLEFGLKDKLEYNWSPAFLPFYDEVKYVNGPDEEKEGDVKPAEKPAEKPADTDSPAMWEKEPNGKRFTLGNVEFRKLYNLLTDKKQGIMSTEISYEYFADAVQRAQWGKIYNHKGTKKANCRKVVNKIAGHATDKADKQDYLEAAAGNMGITKKALSSYNASPNFSIKLDKIL